MRGLCTFVEDQREKTLEVPNVALIYTKDPFLSIKEDRLGVVTDLEATTKKNTEGNKGGNEEGNEGEEEEEAADDAEEAIEEEIEEGMVDEQEEILVTLEPRKSKRVP